MLINKKKSTIFVKTLNLKTSLRYMQTDVETRFPTSTALEQYYKTKNEALLSEVDIVTNYLLEGLSTEKTFSEIIGESSQVIGCHISAESFATFLALTRSSIYKKGGPQALDSFDHIMSTNMDDLYLYYYEEEKLKLKSDYKEIYDGYIDSIYYSSINTDTVSKSLPSHVSSSTVSNDTTYYNIPVPPDSDTSSNSSHSSGGYETDLDQELFDQNRTIAILALTAFIVIQVLVQVDAWYQRKYNKDVVITDETTENTLNSAHEEFLTLTSITVKLLICLIPTFFIILYNFRYYYLYKYLYYIKHKL